MESKVIKGQAWIQGESLVQDQILIVPGQVSSNNVISLIDNVWDDLLSEDGEYKYNGKNYFYWEYLATDIQGNSEVKVNFECPKPKEGLFTAPYDPDLVEGSYAKFWVNKFKTADENAKNALAVQKKEITFPGSTYVNPNTGDPVVVENITVRNNDIGDITNLIGLF